MDRGLPVVLVLGTGSAGARHLRLLASLGTVRAVAVPVREARAEELRREGFEADADLSRALALGPAGAIIATDSGRHVEDAERCLERCPVLVEKPLSVDATLARRAATSAARAGRALHVACCLRFDAGLRWVEERVPQLGRVQHADAECLSWLPAWRPGRDVATGYAARPGEGGVLLDLVHEIDYLSWMLGAPSHVQGSLENNGIVGLPASVEETARLSLRHPGVVSTLRVSYAVRPPSRRLRLWGEQGMLEWNGVERHARQADTSGALVSEIRWPGPEEMYRLQAETWLASLQGRPSPELVRADEGIAAVAICDAARRSSASERWEPVA